MSAHPAGPRHEYPHAPSIGERPEDSDTLMALDAMLIHNTQYELPIMDPTASLGLKVAYVGAVLVGLLQFCCNFNFVYRAEQFITSGLVAVLFALLLVPHAQT